MGLGKVRITRQKLNDIIENEVRLMLTEPAPLELDEDLPAPETEAGLRYELSKAKQEIKRLKRTIATLRQQKSPELQMDRCLQFVSKVVDSSKGKTTVDKTK
jgi:hypothetical protein